MSGGSREMSKRIPPRSLGNRQVIQAISHKGKCCRSYVSANYRKVSALIVFRQPSVAKKREQTHVRGEAFVVIVPNLFLWVPWKYKLKCLQFHPIRTTPESLICTHWPRGRCQFEPWGDLWTASEHVEIDELSGRWHFLTKCQGGIAEIYLVPSWLQSCWETQGASE